MKKLTLALTVLASSNLFAATAPYDDAINQIQTVIQSPLLASAAAGAPIEGLKRLGSLDYEVTVAGSCALIVALDEVTQPLDAPGKIQYKVLNVSAKRCR